MMSAAPAFDPPPLDARLARLLQDYPRSIVSERLYRSIELMERYSIDLAIEILAGLGVLKHMVEWRSAPELRRALSLDERFDLALTWLLTRLLETSCVEARGSGETRQYRLKHQPWKPALASLRATGLAIDPANAATLALLDHAASIYHAVARGETTGEQALFAVAGIDLWLAYFRNDNPSYAINNWVGAFAAVERMADRPKLRILEVGAGAGSGSHALLHTLDARGLTARVERYVITEPNAFFRRRAQRDLSKRHPNLPLEFQPLDVDAAWRGQGIEDASFDLVFGINVLHVAKDLLFSLEQSRAALIDGGWLIAGECLRPYPGQPIYAELMFQILDGFTNVETHPEFRPNPGFLTSAQWQRAFGRAGFAPAEVTPDLARIREIYPRFFTGAICGKKAAGRHVSAA
jgi:SAM-dependent methyltransferase